MNDLPRSASEPATTDYSPALGELPFHVPQLRNNPYKFTFTTT